MVETFQELKKACPITIPVLNAHFEANKGSQIIIEARQQNQDLPDLQIVSTAIQLFQRLKQADKGINNSQQSLNNYGDATVIVRIQILMNIYDKISQFENREEVDLAKFNEILAEFQKENVGLLERMKYKIEYERFMRGVKNLQEHPEEEDRNHIYLRYYDLVAEEVKKQEEQEEKKEEKKKQGYKQGQQEENKQRQQEEKQNEESAQQNNAPQQLEQQNEKRGEIQSQIKQKVEKKQENQNQQKKAKVMDDDPIEVAFQKKKEQEAVLKQAKSVKSSKQVKKEEPQQKSPSNPNTENDLMSLLQKYLQKTNIVSPLYKQSVLNYKVTLNPNKISLNHHKIALNSSIFYSHSEEQALLYAKNAIGSQFVEQASGDTFLVIEIEEGKENIEFIKVDLDMMLSELVNEHMSVGIKTQIAQKRLSVSFPAPFINSLTNLIDSLNTFISVFTHFQSPYFNPSLNLSFSHINKSFIPSLLHGFNADTTLKCCPQIYATLQKHIEKAHQEQGISNKLLLLIFSGFNQNLQLKFKGIEQIDKFLKKMGLQKQKTMLNSVLTEDILGDFIMKNQWKQNKILSPIIKLLIERSESLSFFLLHHKKLGINVKIQSSSLKDLILFR